MHEKIGDLEVSRKWTLLMLFLKRNGFERAKYIKKKNIFKHIGEDCYYHPFAIPAESKLISLGDNVVIAKGVELVTHDMSYSLLRNDKSLEKMIGQGEYMYYTDKITIGNNVMIGVNSVIVSGIL